MTAARPPTVGLGRRSRRAGLLREPLLFIVVTMAGGLAAAFAHHWRIGMSIVAAAMLLAAASRLLLPARTAGLLVVRARALDVAVLGVLGAAVGILALVVPVR